MERAINIALDVGKCLVITANELRRFAIVHAGYLRETKG